MNLDVFRTLVQTYYRSACPFADGHRRTQRDLAEAVGLNATELSNRLNGTKQARLTSENVRAIVRTLAKWGALQTQAEARELLALADCPPFCDAEWLAEPFAHLAPLDPLTARRITLHHNLPATLNSIVGRDDDIATAASLLTTTRLLTITGAGGVGKSRLAVAIAAQLALDADDSYPDGIWYADLATVSDTTFVAQFVASAVGCRVLAHQMPGEVLRDYLCARRLLLVLDNAEHLQRGVAWLLQLLLTACPGLRVIATSRQPLDVAGEVIYTAAPLALPSLDPTAEVGAIAAAPAVQLFCHRAQAAYPGWQLTARNATAVAQLCHRLAGLPLAIETTARLVRALSVEKLCQRIDQPSLAEAYAIPSQQLLQAAGLRSDAMLTDAERTLLRRLSVFHTAFTLEAAEQVAGDFGLRDSDEAILQSVIGNLQSEAVLPALLGLVNKSLLLVEADTPTHYRLLEPIRRYAYTLLLESGEAKAMHARHAQLYLSLAECANTTQEQAAAHARLAREIADLRAAIAWAIGHHPALALRLTTALVAYWQPRNPAEGRRWLTTALDNADYSNPPARAAARAALAALDDLAAPATSVAALVPTSASAAGPIGQAPLAVPSPLLLYVSRLAPAGGQLPLHINGTLVQLQRIPQVGGFYIGDAVTDGDRVQGRIVHLFVCWGNCGNYVGFCMVQRNR